MKIESAIDSLVLEEWMGAAIYAVHGIAIDHNKLFDVRFSEPIRGWLTMRVYKGDILKLEIRVPQKAPSTEIVEESGNVIQLHRSA